MNEMAILPRPRSPHALLAEIREREATLSMLRSLAGEFAALDNRPFFIVGNTIQYTREFNIPPNLLQMLRDEAQALYDLQNEFAARRDSSQEFISLL